MTKIDPTKIWWLIIALWIVPAGLAEVHLASNITTSDGAWSAYSEGIDHKLSASSEGGPSEYALVADLADVRNSSVWQGLIAPQKASFMARTPEYTLKIRDASDFYGTVSLQRDKTIEETEEVVTEVTNDSLVQTTRTVLTDANIEASVRGNGVFSEDIDISSAGKARSLKLRELDGAGNFSLNTSLRLSGQQVKRDFGLLNETELFNRRVILANDTETGTGPLGGI